MEKEEYFNETAAKDCIINGRSYRAGDILRTVLIRPSEADILNVDAKNDKNKNPHEPSGQFLYVKAPVKVEETEEVVEETEEVKKPGRPIKAGK